MSLSENVSELLSELRHAAGTVLTILGSHLEAQERARVDEVGPQWLNEFEEQRDSLDAEQLFECVQPDCGCHDDERYTPIPDDVCDEAEAAETADDAYSIEGLFEERNRRYAASLQSSWRLIPDSSAAVSAAADPSPTVPNAHSVVGGEGSGGASDILQSAPPERSTVPIRFRVRTSYQPRCGACGCDVAGMFPNQLAAERAVSDKGGRCNACFAYLESDPGAVSTPAPGEQVTEDDLAAHIMGDFVSGQEVDPLTATLIDALSSRIARCLLADFHITRK